MPSTKNPVARILNLVKLEKKEISAVYFYAILNGLIQLSLPLGVQAIIGFVLGASMRASLVVLIFLVVTGVLVAGIMQINQMKIIEKIQQKVFARYSFAFAEHIPRMDLHKNDHIYLPELINRFFDIPVLQKSLSKLLLDIPTATVQILAGLVLLGFYHPAFILFGIVLVLMLWLIIQYSGKLGLQTSLDKSTHKYKVAAWLEETARVIKSVKLTGYNDLHLQKTDGHVGNYLQARTKHFKVLLFQYNVLVIFKTIITAAMLIVGTLLLVDQQLNIGQFIAAEIVILLVLTSVEKLIMNLGSAYDTLTAVEKLSNLTDTALEDNGTEILAEKSGGLALEMKNMGFAYHERKRLFEDVSFTIAAGDRVCIKGEDSSGKSTLFRILSGAYTGFTGAYLINGLPLANYNLASVRANIGLLTRDQDIFLGTLRENITLGKQIDIDTITYFARQTGLDEFLANLPKGYDTLLEPTGHRLSRNVVDKILLVRALVASPGLLLLEEPWVNMNPEHSRKLKDTLMNLKDVTLVVITSDEDYAQSCNKIFTIKDGSVTVKENFKN